MTEDNPNAQPTGEFRQLKREIKRGNGICGPGYREEVIGYDVTIQQKWVIEVRGYNHDDSFLYHREVWRDLPTVWEKNL